MNHSTHSLNPFIQITQAPTSQLYFLQPCQYGELTSSRLIRSLAEIKFECEISKVISQAQLYVCVTLVTENEPHYNHPHRLKCFDESNRVHSKLFYEMNKDKLVLSDASFLFRVEPQTGKCKIDNLFVVSQPKHDLLEYNEDFYIRNCLLESRRVLKDDLFAENQPALKSNGTYELGLLHESLKQKLDDSHLKHVDLNNFRLKLQCVIMNLNNSSDCSFLAEPTYTEIFENYQTSRNKYNTFKASSSIEERLRILRTSSFCGNVNGGEEIVLLCNYFDPDDIQVEFIQYDAENRVVWRRFAHTDRTDMHHNCALVIKTPFYDLNQSEKEAGNKKANKIKVYLRLLKPSTKEYGEKIEFYYCKEHLYDLKYIVGEETLENSVYLQNSITRLSGDMNKVLACSSGLKRKNSLQSTSYVDENKKKRLATIDTVENEADSNEIDQLKKELNSLNMHEPNQSKSDELEKCDKECQTESDASNTAVIRSESLVLKMNSLAERTGKALLKFAKTKSIAELLRIQRFLLNTQDDDGNTPIHLSILHGHFDLLQMLVDQALTIPYQNLINIKNKKGLTPLLIACYLQEIELCEFLLEASADMSISDSNGNNSFHIACRYKNTKLLKLLLQKMEKNFQFNVLNNKNHEGYTPLHLAVMSRSTELVRELVYVNTLKINIKDKRAGFTALHHACSLNLINICSLLVKSEHIDLEVRSYSGCTPLLLAMANQNYLISLILLKNGAQKHTDCEIPVHSASHLFSQAVEKQNSLIDCFQFVYARHKNQEIEMSVDDYVKISDEVKDVLSADSNWNSNREFLFENGSSHNYDTIQFVKYDNWMMEILNNFNSLDEEFLHKFICFENCRIQSQNSHLIAPTNNPAGNSKSLIKTNSDKSKSNDQLKLSQQATD